MIHWCKGLGQIDMSESTTDGGKLEAHILWLWRNIEAVNVDIKAAIAADKWVEQSWVKIAIDYLVRVGAIVVVDEGEDDAN
jgi:hypothetical protein